MKFPAIFLLSISYLVLPLTAYCLELENLSGIEVQGSASITAVPDQFLIKLTVKEIGISASKTKLLVDRNSQLIVDEAIALGINAKNIVSTQVNIRIIYESETNNFQPVVIKKPFRQGETIKTQLSDNSSKIDTAYIEVSRQIHIPLDDLSIYDNILDRIVKIGNTEVLPLEMFFKSSELLYQQALDKAVLDAKQKAQQIAVQAGVKLGKLRYIKELSYGRPSPFMLASEARSSNFSSSAGSSVISAQVSAIFALQP